MDEDLGLTFNVEYPVFGDSDQDKLAKLEDFQNQNTEVVAGERKIVVVLLGWSGAKDHQLTKYSDIYLKRGCIIVRCIIPARVTYCDIQKLPLLAKQAVRNLGRQGFQSHPLFFHVLSNGGAIMYTNVLRALASQKERFDVRGTIFDSGPCALTATSLYRAVTVTCNSYKIFGIELGAVIAAMVVFVAVVRVFWHFNLLAWECVTVGSFRRVTSGEEVQEKYPLSEFLHRICKLRNHSFIFLYSEEDVITPSEEVERIAGVLQRRGNPIKLVKFKGSGHVLHYREHPEKYVSAVSNFITSTLESYGGPTEYWDE